MGLTTSALLTPNHSLFYHFSSESKPYYGSIMGHLLLFVVVHTENFIDDFIMPLCFSGKVQILIQKALVYYFPGFPDGNTLVPTPM